MVGYGPEDNHFVVELTYNYGIKHYVKGNDFRVWLYSVMLSPDPVFVNFNCPYSTSQSTPRLQWRMSRSKATLPLRY